MEAHDWFRLATKVRDLQAARDGDCLTPRITRLLHADVIVVSSNLEGIIVSEDDADTIVANPMEDPPADASVAWLQAVGQGRALMLIEEWRLVPLARPFSILLKDLHYTVMQFVDPVSAGNYRRDHRRISGSSVMTSLPEIIPAEVATLSDRVADRLSVPLDVEAVVALAAEVHHEITRIHPFTDGNGRVARLCMNFITRTHGLPYVLIPKVGLEDSINIALKAADEGDLTPAVSLYALLLEDSLDRVATLS